MEKKKGPNTTFTQRNVKIIFTFSAGVSAQTFRLFSIRYKCSVRRSRSPLKLFLINALYLRDQPITFKEPRRHITETDVTCHALSIALFQNKAQ